MTLGWSTSGNPLLVTNVRLASLSPPPPPASPSPIAAGVADGNPAVEPHVPAEAAFFFLRTLPLASGGIFWEGSGVMEAVTPGIVPITLCYCDGKTDE